MRSRWFDEEARAAVERYAQAGEANEDVALRVYTSRLIGAEPDLVLHGGGNTSVKSTFRDVLGQDVNAIFVKGSGWNLDSIEPAGLPGMDLAALRRLRALPALSDEEMVNQTRIHLFDAAAPTPSVETLLHAFLPAKFIDHSHADAVIALTNRRGGEELVCEVMGERVPRVPYVMPGFALALAAAQVHDAHPGAIGLVLLKHGLFTWGETARESYERHVELVDAAERWLAANRRRSLSVAVPAAPARTPHAPPSSGAGALAATPEVLAAALAPVLRGRLAQPTGDPDRPFRRLIVEWHGDPEVMQWTAAAEMPALAATPPLTPDHVIRTKGRPLLIELIEPIEPMGPISSPGASNGDAAGSAAAAGTGRGAGSDAGIGAGSGATPASSPGQAGAAAIDPAALAPAVERALDAYVREYRAYFDAGVASRGPRTPLDPMPRVILVPGVGMFTAGNSRKDARIAADIYRHTMRTKRAVFETGEYEGLPDLDLFDVEYWSLEQAKLGRGAEKPLARQVAMVTGAAGALGSAIADRLLAAGAHVALLDLDEAALGETARRLAGRHGGAVAAGVEPIVADVTDEGSLERAFAEVARRFGGVDVVVPNAGVARSTPIPELAAADWHRVQEVNATGVFLTVREAARMMRRQATGGNIVIVSSKNVFAPGAEFAAYSASKAAASQLGKVAALELAADGIRVNMVNPDAIFGTAENPSGLWREVGPDRARARGMAPEDLPDFYRKRSLLKVPLTGEHVGNAVVFFASNLTPTTGAALPVDGGVPEAFPR